MDSEPRIEILREARKDLKFLLNRGYRKPSALKLVGDKYQLNKVERSILFRSVFSDQEAALIRSKRIDVEMLRGQEILIDGFNVLNTVETMLRGETLILCDDGVLRDFSEVHSKYRLSDLTERALSMVLSFLKGLEVARAELLYESQISRSGEIAGLTRRMMKAIGIEGDARTLRTVDSALSRSQKIVATSDSAILLKCKHFVDIPQSLELAKTAKIIRL